MEIKLDNTPNEQAQFVEKDIIQDEVINKFV